MAVGGSRVGAVTPDEIVLIQDRSGLRISWPDLVSSVVTASALRSRCRCAWCTRDRIEGRFPDSFGDVSVSRLELIGDHAVHIAFSDGHARGIFPWPYLRQIADDTATSPAARSRAA